MSFIVSEPQQLFEASLPGWRGQALGRASKWITKQLVRRSQGVVYVSDRWLQGLYPASNGVPTLARSNVLLDEIAFRDPGAPAIARELLAPKLLSIGALTGRGKGMDLLIRVVAQLHSQGIEASLTIVGSGASIANLRECSRSMGVESAITFTGQVHDRGLIYELMDQSDIYVSASRAEGLPRATVEAMARGLPVVSSDAGAVREILADRWIVAIEDVNAMASRIAELCREPVKRVVLQRECFGRAKQVAGMAEPSRLTRFLVDNYASPSY